MRIRFALTAAALLALAAPALADEGMWTLDNLPLPALKQRHDFTPTRQWTENVQRASVNFGGGSGAFVSPDGLVLTNHHVAIASSRSSPRPGTTTSRTVSSPAPRPPRCPAPTWNSRSCGPWRT